MQKVEIVARHHVQNGRDPYLIYLVMVSEFIALYYTWFVTCTLIWLFFLCVFVNKFSRVRTLNIVDAFM